MKNKEYFWTMKNGEKINVDDMTESHLKNVLKLIIRRAKEEPKDCEHHVDDAMDLASYDDTPFCDDWMWKQFYFITYTRCCMSFLIAYNTKIRKRFNAFYQLLNHVLMWVIN